MNKRHAIILKPGEGRSYDGGPVTAVFKADDDETARACSISEWWLEPHTKAPGPHSHPEDDIFYVIEGTIAMFVDGRWMDAPKGSFILVPGGSMHDFENRTSSRAGFLNVSAPGGFEEHMHGIAQWFRERAPEDARA